ncbi:MAG TPA: EAL domain-containing protein [Burkholderiaceae bacterium]|nr:EAL domain-containing protein [Burkholderiaceae bacterium]
MHIPSTARLCLLIATPTGAVAQESASGSPLSSAPDSPIVWLALVLLPLLLVVLWRCAGLKRQLRRKTRELQQTEERLNTILDSADACIYIKDMQLRYTYGNRKLCERFGRAIEEIIGSDDSVLFPEDMLDAIRAADLRVIELGRRVVYEEEIPSKSGTGMDVFLSIKIPLRGPGGEITALCGISTDITEQRKSQQEVERLVYYDALTNLPNRRMLLEQLEIATLEYRNTGAISAVLFIDLDKFKNINDEKGHDVGDAVLCTVAERLQRLVQQGDMVARLGGDEFVLLLRELGKEKSQAEARALAIAERARASLSDTLTVNDEAYFTGGSIGATLIDSRRKNPNDILREADTAMYQSKDAGRNRVALFRPAMLADVAERAALLREMDQALHTNQFQLLVQPQVDSAGQVDGLELLMRWDHPTRGIIMPEKFIGLIENSGPVVEIGEWVLRRACALHGQLTQYGRHHPVSVNISPVQLRHPDFNSRVKAILAETGTSPQNIILELTESVLIEDVDDTARRMQALADFGVRFSIDDFGTGYSGLAYLHRLPLHELKIARTFIQDIPDKDAGTLIRLIIATARLLELRVVAEGVERLEQADFLISVGCDSQQGYFHQHPIALETWLENCRDYTDKA